MTLVDSILFFLAVSLMLYAIFGGADFGAGILELFLDQPRREDQRALIAHAMAPVWEANHVWLILAVVILFMGFPSIYTSVSVLLHIPLMAILMGIVARGCAFTFRHYDTVQTYRRTYTRIFAYSSLWTAFFLGVCSGVFMIGHLDPNAVDFFDLFIGPWLNAFCMSLGLFTVGLFMLLASVFLVGEAEDQELKAIFRRKARNALILVVVSGGLVFLSGETVDISLFDLFVSHPLSIVCFALATLLLPPFYLALQRSQRTLWVRLLGVVIMVLVMLGWFAVQYPWAIRYAPPHGDLSFYAAAAPEATLKALLAALIVGSLLIFPALFYLMKVFKWQTLDEEQHFH